MKNQKIIIKYLANHFYLPMIVSETEKIDYLNHIINVDEVAQLVEHSFRKAGVASSILDFGSVFSYN